MGFAFPIEFTFRALNKDGWTFIYDVLKRYPMTEIYRLSLQSISEYAPDNPDIQFAVYFLFVPRLFDTMENVRKVLQELQQQQSPSATPAPAAGSPATNPSTPTG